MAKKERKMVDTAATQNIKDIQAGLGSTTADLQTQVQPARDQAGKAYSAASGAAAGLAGGEANPYAAGLATGTTNPYATNLAVTGGVSEDEAQAMETAATRGVRSVYDIASAEAKRKAAITGGYGGGGEISKIARQSEQAQAEAITGAKATTAGMRQTGRISGAGLVGQAEATGAGLVNQQQIAGAQMLTTQYGLTQDQANAVMNQILQAQTAGMQLTQADIGLLAEMSKQPGGLSAAVTGIGQLASGVGGLLGGIGTLGGARTTLASPEGVMG